MILTDLIDTNYDFSARYADKDLSDYTLIAHDKDFKIYHDLSLDNLKKLKHNCSKLLQMISWLDEKN